MTTAGLQDQIAPETRGIETPRDATRHHGWTQAEGLSSILDLLQSLTLSQYLSMDRFLQDKRFRVSALMEAAAVLTQPSRGTRRSQKMRTR